MAARPQKPQSRITVFLDQPPSCLEFCPAAANYFVIGTYLLSETEAEDGSIQQKKTGSVQLWKFDPGASTLSLIQRVLLPYAVFDLHFHPDKPQLFAISSSAGSVALFRVGPAHLSESMQMEQIWSHPVHDDLSVPALFLSWTPGGWLPDSRDGLAVAFADGKTSVFSIDLYKTTDDKCYIAELGSYHAQQPIEIWFTALEIYHGSASDTAGHNHHIQSRTRVPFLFTGNDFGSVHTRRFFESDSVLSREAADEPQGVSIPNLLRLHHDHDDRARHHSAGVTSILCLPVPLVEDAPVLLTGSYDEYLRVYHATPRGNILAEVSLGGGVWRLQVLRTESEDDEGSEWRFIVLASCMHAGTRLVRVNRRNHNGKYEWDMSILAEFTEHESMNYASDTWKGNTGACDRELVCVSSSFYDRRLCLWTAEV